MFQEAVGLERRRRWRSLLPNFNLHRFKNTPWPQSIIFHISYKVLTHTGSKHHLDLNISLLTFFTFLLQCALEQESSEPHRVLRNVLSASFLTTLLCPDYAMIFFQTNIKKMRCSYSKRRDKLPTVVKTGSGLSLAECL